MIKKVINFTLHFLLTIAGLPFLLFIMLSRFIKTDKIDITYVFSVISIILAIIFNHKEYELLLHANSLHMFLAEFSYFILITIGHCFLAYTAYGFTKRNLKFSIKNYYNYLKNN